MSYPFAASSRRRVTALLMAIRDSRIDGVIEFFGASDYFGPFVQGVIRDALQGRQRALSAVDYVDDVYIQPLKKGEQSIADVRPELTMEKSGAAGFKAFLSPDGYHHPLSLQGSIGRTMDYLLQVNRSAEAPPA